LQRSIRGLRKPEQRAALMAAMNHLVLLGWVRPANPREHDNRVTRWTVNQAVHLTFADQRAAAAARIAERQAAVQRALAACRLCVSADGCKVESWWLTPAAGGVACGSCRRGRSGSTRR
jgi:hypothetical protein